MIIALFFALFIVFQSVTLFWKKMHIVEVNEHLISIQSNKHYGLSRAVSVWLVLAIFAIIAHVTDHPISIEKPFLVLACSEDAITPSLWLAHYVYG